MARPGAKTTPGSALARKARGRAVGPYRLVRPLGKGGMATVFEAQHATLRTRVALKVTRPNVKIDTRILDPFLHEVRSMASLDHPGIVRVHDFGWVDAGDWLVGDHTPGTPTTWLAMDLFEGGTARELLWSPRLEWSTIRSVLVQVLDALAYAHSWGLVHRDVKPENILLRGGDAPLDAVVLTDFGLAHAGEEKSAPGQVEKAYGTPRYMAPEQLRGRWRDYGPWTDLYAVGWLGWELAQRDSPVAGMNFDDLVEVHLGKRPRFRPVIEVPDGFRDWINVALSVDPEDRFQSAAEARRALGDVADDASWSAVSYPTDWRRLSTPRTAAPGSGLGLLPLRKPPTTGREAERDLLWDSFLDCAAVRAPRLVVLTGESGVGKSHLAGWLIRRVREAGLGLTATARHAAQPGPRDGIAGLMSRLLVCQGLDREALRWRLELLSDGVPNETEYDRLGLVEVMLPEGDPLHASDRVAFRHASERHRLVARALVRRARRRPLVLQVDDAQWALDTLGLVEELLGTDHPILLVLTERPSAVGASAEAAQHLDRLLARPESRRVPLGPLPASDQSALLRSMVPLAESVAERLVERSGGNPLFALQLLGDQAEREQLEARGAVYSLRSDAQDALPGSIRDLWTRRLDTALGADPHRRRSLWLAATLGLEVDGAEWTVACGCADVDIDPRVLDALVHAGLVSVDAPRLGGGWAFSHHLLREALLAEAEAEGWLTAAHAACYVALSQAEVARERLAPHAEGLGRPLEAFELWVQGGRLAMERGAWGIVEQAVEGTRRCLTSAGVEGADERWLQPDLLRLRRTRFGGSPADGVALGMQLLERASALGWTEGRAQLLLDLGFLAVLEGTLEQGQAWLDEALLWAAEDTPQHRIVRSRVFRVLGAACKYRGRLKDALRHFDEAEFHAGEQADRAFGMALRVDRGAIYSLLGEHERARALLQEARAICRDLGLRYTEMQIVENLVHVCLVEGELGDAMACCQEALAVDREISGGWQDDLYLLLTVIHVARSEFPEADEVLQRIEASDRQRFGRGEELDLRVARMVTDVGLGRPVSLERLDAVQAEVDKLGRVLALYGRCFAMGAHAATDPALARGLFGAALAQFEALGHEDAAAEARARIEAIEA